MLRVISESLYTLNQRRLGVGLHEDEWVKARGGTISDNDAVGPSAHVILASQDGWNNGWKVGPEGFLKHLFR
jgi:hypothetical protein